MRSSDPQVELAKESKFNIDSSNIDEFRTFDNKEDDLKNILDKKIYIKNDSHLNGNVTRNYIATLFFIIYFCYLI